MFRGANGQDEQARERDPAGFLANEPGVWESGGDGAPVLGRPMSMLRPVDEDDLPSIEDLGKLADPEMLQEMLGRLKRREEG
jgi:hypothetical protein